MQHSRRQFIQLTGWSLGACLLAKTIPARADLPASELPAVGASDLLLASEWMATSYEITPRVPQEMLYIGHTYSDVLIALALMSKGASLNELLELRPLHRWEKIAQKVEIDPQTLAAPIRELLPLTRKPERTLENHSEYAANPYAEKSEDQEIVPSTPVLHFLPDVYVGQRRDLSLNAFTPVLPTSSQVKRFRLDDDEIRNIRTALDDPLGVPESLLLETAGRGGLKVGDWVLAGVVTHHRPLSIDNLLAARAGEQLSWSETCLAFGLRPDVLTRGPLAGIYPVMAGAAPNTVLVARRRTEFPSVPSRYDLNRLSRLEQAALLPLMVRSYRLGPGELTSLSNSRLDLAQQGIVAGLSRLAKVDVNTILDLKRGGRTFQQVVSHLSLDMTGELALGHSILARETAKVPQ